MELGTNIMVDYPKKGKKRKKGKKEKNTAHVYKTHKCGTSQIFSVNYIHKKLYHMKPTFW